MDYRVVKQYLNDAIDNFFKFFYKIADFGKILVDTGYAFFEIWYNFAMFFINIFLYVYYLILYGIDRMSMSSAPIFFWRKKGSATRRDFVPAYNKNMINPVSGMYSKGKTVSSSISSSASRTVSSVANAASAGANNVQSAASSVVAAKVSVKRNIFSDIFKAIGRFIAGIFKAIFHAFQSVWNFLLSKLKPVKEQPVGRKNLIDDYMKQYESRKKR